MEKCTIHGFSRFYTFCQKDACLSPGVSRFYHFLVQNRVKQCKTMQNSAKPSLKPASELVGCGFITFPHFSALFVTISADVTLLRTLGRYMSRIDLGV